MIAIIGWPVVRFDESPFERWGEYAFRASRIKNIREHLWNTGAPIFALSLFWKWETGWANISNSVNWQHLAKPILESCPRRRYRVCWRCLVPAWFLREPVGKIERILYGYSMGKHIWFIIQQVRNVWAQLVHESLRLLTWKGSLLKDSQTFARASLLSIRWDSKKETDRKSVV